jgi:hypothetical protein
MLAGEPAILRSSLVEEGESTKRRTLQGKQFVAWGLS